MALPITYILVPSGERNYINTCVLSRNILTLVGIAHLRNIKRGVTLNEHGLLTRHDNPVE